MAKLKACQKIADFSDAKKDVELKEAKKECLIEIIDVLDEPEAAEYIIKERVLEAAMQMISANLFRTFANKSKFSNNLNLSLTCFRLDINRQQEDIIVSGP